MTFQIGNNYVLNETILDSNYEPILHAGERVEIYGFNFNGEWCLIRNKIDERIAVHRSKLTPVRGRPMRVIG